MHISFLYSICYKWVTYPAHTKGKILYRVMSIRKCGSRGATQSLPTKDRIRVSIKGTPYVPILRNVIWINLKEWMLNRSGQRGGRVCVCVSLCAHVHTLTQGGCELFWGKGSLCQQVIEGEKTCLIFLEYGNIKGGRSNKDEADGRGKPNDRLWPDPLAFPCSSVTVSTVLSLDNDRLLKDVSIKMFFIASKTISNSHWLSQ